MPKKILYIKPAAYDSLNGEIKAYLEKYKDDDTIVDVVSMPRGPKHLEYMYYQTMAAQEILKAIRQGELAGYDAAVIGCFDDPSLEPAREICERMFVTGPGESSMLLAATLGEKFSIIVGRDKCVHPMRENVYKYGFQHKLASFRSLDLGVLELHENLNLTHQRMREAIDKAVKEDKAEVILLGCTMEFGFFEQLQQEFGVPVIDVMVAAFKYAEYLSGLRQKTNWFTSKICTYASPDPVEIRFWQIAEDYGLEGLW